MLEVQKNTFHSIILSKTYSDNSFMAKSITLDFLFGFNNPYTAIITLNECLSENNRLAKMGLNCIYGIILGVKEYKEFYQTPIVYDFIRTLINAITYKIDDFCINNYRICMEKIIEFIGENIDFKLIIPFFELVSVFLFCKDDSAEREAVFSKYCKVLDCVCKDLKNKDSRLLSYNLMSVKEELSEIELNENSALNQVNKILHNIYNEDKSEMLIVSNKSEMLIVSNLKEKNISNSLINKLQRENYLIDVKDVEKESLMRITDFNNIKIILLIDLENEDFGEMLYMLGLMEGKLDKGRLLGCFYNCDKANTEVFLQNLIGRYAIEDNLDDALRKFLH